MKLTLPLTLTLLRVAAIPVVLLLCYWPVPYARQAATVLYALAAFTDWLDGYLARLIRQGFKSRATLVLSSGDRIELEHDGPVDVSDSLRVVLQGKALDYGDRKALVAAFPEADENLS